MGISSKIIDRKLPEFFGIKPFDETSKFSFISRVRSDLHAEFESSREYPALMDAARRALNRARSGMFHLTPMEIEITEEDGSTRTVYQAEQDELEIDLVLSDLEETNAGARVNSGVRFLLDVGGKAPVPLSAGVNMILGGTKSGKSELLKAIALEIRKLGHRVKPVLMNEPAGQTSLSTVLERLFWGVDDVIVIDSITALDYSLPSAPARKEGANPNVPLMLQYLNNVALLKNVVVIATYNIENVTSLQAVIASQSMSCMTLTGGVVSWTDWRWLTNMELWGVRDTRTPIPAEILKKAIKLKGLGTQGALNSAELLNLSEGAMMVNDISDKDGIDELKKPIISDKEIKSDRITAPRSNFFIEKL